MGQLGFTAYICPLFLFIFKQGVDTPVKTRHNQGSHLPSKSSYARKQGGFHWVHLGSKQNGVSRLCIEETRQVFCALGKP